MLTVRVKKAFRHRKQLRIWNCTQFIFQGLLLEKCGTEEIDKIKINKIINKKVLRIDNEQSILQIFLKLELSKKVIDSISYKNP